MRQVNRDELIHLIYDGMRGVSITVRKMLLSPDQRTRDQGRMMLANVLASKFDRLEILSQAPEPPAFRWANFGGGTGAPMIEE